MSTSLGVFRREVARTDLPRKNLNEKTSAYMTFVSLANEALQVQVKKAVCWPAPFFFFGFFCRNSFDRDVGQFAAK